MPVDGKFYGMFDIIVLQVNPFVFLHYPVNTNFCTALPCRSLQNLYVYVVNGLPVPVMHREALPIGRETRLDMQPVLFKFEPQK